MGLIPKNEKYFDLLNAFVAQIHEGAALYARLFDEFERNAEYAEQIKHIERICDRHSADIVEKLNGSFITPLDREDIYVLAIELDDIMDMVNQIARLTVLFGVSDSTPAARTLAHLLQDAVGELVRAVGMLKSRSDMGEPIARIRHLEEEGDRVSQEAIQQLFLPGNDPLETIKWLKIYETMEGSLDRCKKVAKVLNGIVVKNA